MSEQKTNIHSYKWQYIDVTDSLEVQFIGISKIFLYF